MKSAQLHAGSTCTDIPLCRCLAQKKESRTADRNGRQPRQAGQISPLWRPRAGYWPDSTLPGEVRFGWGGRELTST